MAQLVKTVQGLAIASVKTAQGLAIASVKTILGVDNTSGGSPNAFSDDFNRANGALGANWTTSAGAADINSNAYRSNTGSFGNVISVYNTSAGSLTQYVRVTLGVTNIYPWIILRYTDASSPFYAFQVTGTNGLVEWYKFPNAAGSGTLIASATMAGGDMTGQTYGISLSGTGAGTVVNAWRQITGIPSAVGNWNGDTSPDQTFGTPGANNVDTGQLVAIGGQTSLANTMTLEDFFGGGL